MKNKLSVLLLCSLAFGFGVGFNNIAMSTVANQKIAYVNVNKLLASSKSLKSAQETKKTQTQEMLKWYDTASAEINKQTTKAAKEELIKKYEAQLTQKKKNIKDAYAKKVTAIDAQLNTVISQQAQTLGYDIVLRKDSVLYGGTDITSQIVPLVK